MVFLGFVDDLRLFFKINNSAEIIAANFIFKEKLKYV